MPFEGKQAFARLVEASVNLNRVPTKWKMEICVPIAKPGKSHFHCDGYRPVSLTSVCCKVAERIVLDVLSRSVELDDT